MDKEKIKTEFGDTGHKIDDFVEDTAEKHNYPKWKVWVGFAIAGLAVVGVCRLAGWI